MLKIAVTFLHSRALRARSSSCPASFHYAGADKRTHPATRMRPSFDSSLRGATRRSNPAGSATKQSSQCRRTFRSPGQPHRRTGLLRLRLAMTTKKKRKRNADRRVSQPPHLSMRRAPLSLPPPPRAGEGWGGGALAYRRSTTALAVRAFGPWAQLQARLPGTWQDVRSGTVAPTGEQRSCALTRALPAPACPSPGNAPPGPVIVPVSMMPEAARERSVSFRPRAPHSLRLQEYPRPKASFTERDSRTVTQSVTISQGKCDRV